MSDTLPPPVARKGSAIVTVVLSLALVVSAFCAIALGVRNHELNRRLAAAQAQNQHSNHGGAPGAPGFRRGFGPGPGFMPGGQWGPPRGRPMPFFGRGPREFSRGRFGERFERDRGRVEKHHKKKHRGNRESDRRGGRDQDRRRDDAQRENNNRGRGPMQWGPRPGNRQGQGGHGPMQHPPMQHPAPQAKSAPPAPSQAPSSK